MDAYLILGHGIENPIDFEERNILPEGYTLVTLAECGLITTKEEVCPSIEAFLNPELAEIIQNPKKNKEIIKNFLKKDIHVYQPGDKYPELTVQLFVDWHNDQYTTVSKSGMYKFPINNNDMKIIDKELLCEKIFQKIGPYKGFFSILPDDFDETLMFKGSIFPKTEQVSEKIKETGKRSDKLKESLTYSLEELFKQGGPGVYYYVICRHPKNVKAPANIVEEDLVADPSRYEAFRKRNWISNLDAVIPLVEENIKSSKPESWAKKELTGILENYKRMQKIPLIRRLSIHQQGKGRTRKQKIKNKKTRKQKKRV